jgi:predicted nucleic acid-binding protein
LIALGDHPLSLGVRRDQAPEWLQPLIDAGRDAAYIDTGYLRGLVDERDERHLIVTDHWRSTKAVFYTSPLVVAEAVRQVAKHGGVDQEWRWEKIDQTKTLFIDDRMILVCAPPDEVVRTALVELVNMQRILVRLDLCDSLSMVILDAVQHRRVLGFDDHFRAVGAALEPA